jgi:hypothetical protein
MARAGSLCLIAPTLQEFSAMRVFVWLATATVCLVSLPIVAAPAAEAAPASALKFVPIFNGKNLDGWEGDTDLWHVEGGEIVGSTENKKIATNSFLATRKHYKNFVLKVKFKLTNHNSGVQFRSQLQKDYVVVGYQADIADTGITGMLWDEEGRGVLERMAPEKIAPHLNKDDWNQYVITADGPHITMAINGFTVVDYTEKSGDAATEGIIALQLHTGPAMKVEFKEIEIAEMP